MCNKVAFETQLLANKRANEINKENKSNDMRGYKCDKCKYFHLTSMSKHKHKWITSVQYRNKVREDRFLKDESEYWERHFNVN